MSTPCQGDMTHQSSDIYSWTSELTAGLDKILELMCSEDAKLFGGQGRFGLLKEKWKSKHRRHTKDHKDNTLLKQQTPWLVLMPLNKVMAHIYALNNWWPPGHPLSWCSNPALSSCSSNALNER
jgi:hypothetical protein